MWTLNHYIHLQLCVCQPVLFIIGQTFKGMSTFDQGHFNDVRYHYDFKKGTQNDVMDKWHHLNSFLHDQSDIFPQKAQYVTTSAWEM